MKVFRVSRKGYGGYDTYDSFVCVAENEIQARCMHPKKMIKFDLDRDEWVSTNNNNKFNYATNTWVNSINDVEVEEIDLSKMDVILSSFNAG